MRQQGTTERLQMKTCELCQNLHSQDWEKCVNEHRNTRRHICSTHSKKQNKKKNTLPQNKSMV